MSYTLLRSALTALLMAGFFGQISAAIGQSSQGERPWFTTRLGYVHMWRQNDSDIPLVVPDAGMTPSFTSSDFSFDGRPGIDVSMSWHSKYNCGIDVRYVGADSFLASGQHIALADPQIATILPTDSVFAALDVFTLNTSSTLRSVEVLGHHQLCGQWDVNLGYRYMELDEWLRIDVNQPLAFLQEVGFDAGNRLNGIQIGLDGPLWDHGGRFRMDAFSNFGMYYNKIDTWSYLRDPAAPAVSGSGTSSNNHTAFGMELGLYASYAVTRRIAIRSGYQMLLLDGVALAADQVPNTGDLYNLPTTVSVMPHADNTILFHGLNLGLEFRL